MSIPRPFLAIVIAVFLVAVCAGRGLADEPAPGTIVLVSLSTGEIFRGKLVAADDKAVTIDHATLGRLQMPRAQVSAISLVPETTPPPAPAPAANSPSAPKPAAAAPAAAAPAATPPTPPAPAVTILPPPKEVKPDPETFWDGWKHSAELGLNGAEGNSRSLSVRGGLTLDRETSLMETKIGASYNYATANGQKSTDHGELGARNDYRIAPPWRIYVQGLLEYDTFQDWRWRLSAASGLGYEVIKDDNTLLLGRVGAGFSKQFQTTGSERIEPELDLGLDFNHKFDDRQSFFVTLDYYPSLHRFTDYRATGKAGYELLVDPVHAISLKLGVEDRYQSVPGDGKKRNDLLYFAALVFDF